MLYTTSSPAERRAANDGRGKAQTCLRRCRSSREMTVEAWQGASLLRLAGAFLGKLWSAKEWAYCSNNMIYNNKIIKIFVK